VLAPFLLIGLLWTQVQVTRVQAVELFGVGTLYHIQTGERITGFVDGWGGWLLYGTTQDCRLLRLYGVSIDGVNGAIPCHMDFNADATRFKGWIDFRGHPRPFCGTATNELPIKCYGE